MTDISFRAALIAPLIGVLVLAGCGGESGDPTEEVKVVASTGVVADILEAVAGPDAEVVQIIPDGASPHSYAASAQDRREIAEATLAVFVADSLEEGLPLEDSERSFELAEHIDADPADGKDDHQDDEHDHGDEKHGDEEPQGEDEHGHSHDGEDPHIWLDPTKVAATLPELADALAEADPDSGDAYRERAGEFAAELRALDRDLADVVDELPEERRKLVTSHDAFGHFADRYDFEVVGAAFGTVPESEASARRVADLVDAIEAEAVPAVFAQEGDDPEVLRQIADEAGVEVIDDLRVSSPGENGSYAEMLRFTTERIVGALSG